jgi:hypothetical protein
VLLYTIRPLLLYLLHGSIVGIVQDISEICRMQQQEAEQKTATAQLNAMLAAVSTSFTGFAVHMCCLLDTALHTAKLQTVHQTVHDVFNVTASSV